MQSPSRDVCARAEGAAGRRDRDRARLESVGFDSVLPTHCSTTKPQHLTNRTSVNLATCREGHHGTATRTVGHLGTVKK